VLQQLEYLGSQDVSVNDCFRPISKYWDRINRPEQIVSSLPEAVRVLTDQAETGAVTVCLPEDVQAEAYDFPEGFFAKRVYRIPRQAPPESELKEALGMMRKARRPLIIAGGGVIYSEASGALDELARTCRIPVCETQAGKGSLAWDHPWSVGPVGANGGLAANRLAAEADLVMGIGTRLSDFTTASHSAFQNPEVRFVNINVTPMDAYKLGGLALVGDARATVMALTQALKRAGYGTGPEYEATTRDLKHQWDEAVELQRESMGPVLLTQANVIGIVNSFSQPRDVVVCAAGGLPGDLLKLWRTRDPKGYHLEYGYSCMGYEIAGGLGVKMADPSREVHVMLGDGSYLMLSNEIVTSIQEGQKLTIVLLDNHGFQCIRGLQEASGSPAFGNELRYRDEVSGLLDGPYIPIDFVKNAESLGAKGYYADTKESLEDALSLASRERRTVLIYVPIAIDSAVPSYDGWWDVPIAEASEEKSVQESLRSYREAKKKQKLYG